MLAVLGLLNLFSIFKQYDQMATQGHCRWSSGKAEGLVGGIDPAFR